MFQFQIAIIVSIKIVLNKIELNEILFWRRVKINKKIDNVIYLALTFIVFYLFYCDEINLYTNLNK